MAYDAARGVSVLFDGTSRPQVTTAVSLAGRARTNLAYGSARSVVVRFLDPLSR